MFIRLAIAAVALGALTAAAHGRLAPGTYHCPMITVDQFGQVSAIREQCMAQSGTLSLNDGKLGFVALNTGGRVLCSAC